MPVRALCLGAIGLPVLLFGVVPGAAQETTSKDHPGGDFKKCEALIRQLGSAKYAERAKAQRQLLATPMSRPLLRKALKSPHVEIARRASLILAELDNERQKQLLGRLKTFVDQGKIDLAAWLAYHWPQGFEEKACFMCMLDLVEAIAAKDQKAGGHTQSRLSIRRVLNDHAKEPYLIRERKLDLDMYIKCREIRDEVIFARVEKFLPIPSYMGIVICKGDYHGWVQGKVRGFAFGSMEIQRVTDSGAILICDGDVVVHDYIAGALVIARGKVTIDGLITTSRIFGSSVHFTSKASGVSRSTVLAAFGAEPIGNPLPGFRHIFFELKHVGLEVTEEKLGLRVKSVDQDKNKRFAQAGLQAGDVILEMDGDLVLKAENFRRSLRARFAFGDTILLTVSRVGRPLHMLVDLNDVGP